ncbi:YciI family protein [Caulobacter sp. 1776]|uniref:YciI family protein n=1 Tax=Caulobacter sp. 1776 TaxID=3156420 RepID=UPI003390B63C
MLYAILCYNQEDVICAWSKEHKDGVMQKLMTVQQRLSREGRLGPVARLMPTTAATTLRKDREPALVLDGPFAETKEQLLGFYVVDCDSLDGALEIAKDLGKANPGGSYEIRPIALFQPGEAGGAGA